VIAEFVSDVLSADVSALESVHGLSFPNNQSRTIASVPESHGLPLSRRKRVALDVPISLATSRMLRSSIVLHLRITVPSLMARILA
jgi:hypothetical protein